jgi:hypothetical protein
MRPRSLQFWRLYSGRIVVCLIRNFPAGPHNRSNSEVFMKAIYWNIFLSSTPQEVGTYKSMKQVSTIVPLQYAVCPHKKTKGHLELGHNHYIYLGHGCFGSHPWRLFGSTLGCFREEVIEPTKDLCFHLKFLYVRGSPSTLTVLQRVQNVPSNFSH